MARPDSPRRKATTPGCTRTGAAAADRTASGCIAMARSGTATHRNPNAFGEGWTQVHPSFSARRQRGQDLGRRTHAAVERAVRRREVAAARRLAGDEHTILVGLRQ